MNVRDWVILSGHANQPLAQKICEKLGKSLGHADVRRFSDGEIFVEIKENVRGRNVYVIQSTCRPVNDTLMELLVMIDALKRASANEITALVPYYGYARQDRKVAPRTPISAKLVADLFAAAGATRVVSMDLHAAQIQGFFNVPFDNLFASPVILEYIRNEIGTQDLVIVSPDTGGMERARAFAKRLNTPVVMVDKRRTAPNVAKALNIIGEVEGKNAIILDDMIDTAGTLCEAAHAVFSRGATRVCAVATHGVFSGPAVQRIFESGIDRVIVTDTIPLPQECSLIKSKIVQLSVSGLLAEAIHRIHRYDSLSSLFL